MRRRDLIDFPVSDVWRDHYAAQGLTYDSGRRQHARMIDSSHSEQSSSESGMMALLKLVREQEAQIKALTAELLKLKRTRDDSRGSFEGVE